MFIVSAEVYHESDGHRRKLFGLLEEGLVVVLIIEASGFSDLFPEFVELFMDDAEAFVP